MRIAVLGAGFAGLATTWHLLNYTQGSTTIDLFDPEPVGSGASGLSSGLLHAYSGKHAKKSWEADRCLKETHRLITVASQAVRQPLVLSKGILRPALLEEQIADFENCSKTHADTQWWDKKRCESTIDGLTLPSQGGGLFIPDGLTIDAKKYLLGLWQACALLGTQLYSEALIRPSDLDRYDRILVAIGPLSTRFPPLKDLPITPVKGQMLELKWPTHVPPLPHSLISQKYLVMGPDYTTCFVGATFEHYFDSLNADLKKAKQEILPHILSFFPALNEAEVIGCRTGCRASTSGDRHLPLVGKVSDKIYFFAGLGSKGLLYHAWLGKRVARAILSSQEKHFPPKAYYRLPEKK
jgi:glycine/D-amino acid oxidase-like deaminating enzyme